jgi:aromatic ring-cleaving dioxygenase
VYALPEFLTGLGQIVPWINVEYIGGTAIEVHLRYNDDFRNHSGDMIYPVWKDNPLPQPQGSTWYPSAGGDRLGFWIVNK